MKDLIIIGAGPAGITAAVYAARKKLDFCVVTKDIGGQAAMSGKIENYTGYQFITGTDLVQKFKDHIQTSNFDLRENQGISGVIKENQGFKVILDNGEEFMARTVIVATGKKPRSLDVPGEQEFKNRGVTYCATCDGPLFAGKDVAVIGGGNSALDAALQMIRIASKVYLVNLTDKLSGDPVMIEKVQAADNVEILNNAKTTEFFGDKFLKGMRVEVRGERKEIPLEGVFIEAGLIPNSGMIDFVHKNEKSEIVINCAAQTSEPGIFAAGDVTSVPEKQIIIAAGDGAKAALSAFRYLSTHK